MNKSKYRKLYSKYSDYYLDAERRFTTFSRLKRKGTKVIAKTKRKEKSRLSGQVRAYEKRETKWACGEEA